MRKILFIGMTSNHGGIETFMINIFRKLKNVDHFDFIQDSDENLFYHEEITESGGKIFKVNVGNSYFSHFTRYNKACNFFKTHNDYDVVHLNSVSINTIFWLLAAKKFGINKLIIHSHNDRVTLSSKIKLFFTKLLSSISLIQLKSNKDIIKIAASESAGEWMFHSDDFSVISNGIEVQKFLYNEKKANGIKNFYKIGNKKVLMTLSRIEYQKNFFMILKIFKEIVLINNNIVLIICGDGTYKQKVLEYAKTLGIEQQIIFAGNVSDVNAYLSAADLILMPSLYEALPFSIVESQANGAQSLVSEESVPKGIDVTGSVKFYSLDKSPNEWAKNSVRLINNSPSNREKMEMNDMVKQSRFNIDETIKEIKRIYN